jgi:hypothetical protein
VSQVQPSTGPQDGHLEVTPVVCSQGWLKYLSSQPQRSGLCQYLTGSLHVSHFKKGLANPTNT